MSTDDKQLIRHLENEVVLQDMIIDAIRGALEGQEPSDFEQSFDVVRQVWELYIETKGDKQAGG